MKLLSESQQAKIRLRYELVLSALTATVLVSLMVICTSPLAYNLLPATV